ncbi:MAG TPA: HDOD domain-containing protein [Syntrophorhabdaceae bacterium]|nr:HDOD domain-containing protein [Syntrophorhabdaceae bacterium]
MYTNVIVILLLIVVIALLFVLKGKKKKKTITETVPRIQRQQPVGVPRPQSAAAGSTIKAAEPQPQKKQEPLRVADSHIETASVIKEIEYSQFPPGILPKPLEDLDTSMLASVFRDKMSQVRPIPSNSVRLLDLLKNPFSNWNDISAAVSTNPMFSAKILQAVNSAYFNLPDKVTSVGRAITLLGYNNVRALVLEDVLETLTVKTMNTSSDAYMKACIHSAVVSACSGYLSKTAIHASEYDTATIGLLHDIGKYYISSLEPLSGTSPQHPLYWLKTLRPRPPLLIREQIEYGLDHTVLGSMLAKKWELSDVIRYSIQYHHYPAFMPPDSIPKPYITHAFVISLSDLICKALGYGMDDDEMLEIRPEYYDMFGLDHDPTKLITPALTKEVTNAYFTVKAYVGQTDAR